MKLISVILLVSIWLNGQTLNLISGWNVVALQSDTNVSIFRKNFPQISNIFRYDGAWHKDGNIKSSDGIWLHVENNTTLKIESSTKFKNNFEDISLHSGWNLVGLPSPYSIYPKAFNGHTLWRYKNAKWNNKSGTAVATGEAFWIYSENEKIINITKESSKLYSFDNDLDINNYLETIASHKQLVNYNGYSSSSTASLPVTDGIIGNTGSTDTAVAPPTSPTSTSTATSTNLQEADVDESDIIKHNGKTIFYLSRNDNTIKINTFERLSKNLTEPISSIKLVSYPSELYIKENNLIVMYPSIANYSSLWNYSYRWRGKSKIELYDVSKIDAINKIANYDFDGNIIDSRIVDNKLYIISRFSPYIETTYKKIDCEINKPSTPSIPSFLPQPGLTQAQASSISSYSTILKSTRAYSGCYDYSTLIYGKKFLAPTLYDITNETNTSLLKAQTFFAPPKEKQEPFITTISTFDINTLKYQESLSLTTSSYTVYSSANAIYLASHNYSRYYSETVSEKRSTIYKIAIGKSLNYRGKVDVGGTLLNQFSLSEHKNILRVATTVSDNWRETDNRIYTIEENNNELNILGTLTGLGEVGERITGVRFFGDKAYVVTFRRTDPLYTIDLSNPSKPKAIGELKIPGFSNYFHPISDKLILSIGRDANIFGRTQGVQLQLFDISNFANPAIVDKVVIGESTTQSSALNNHKAFTYRPSDKTIAIPISQNNYGYSGIELAELLTTTKSFSSNEPSLQVNENNNELTNDWKSINGLFLFRIKDDSIVPISTIESKNTDYTYRNNDRSIIFTFNGLNYAVIIVEGIATVKQVPN